MNLLEEESLNDSDNEAIEEESHSGDKINASIDDEDEDFVLTDILDTLDPDDHRRCAIPFLNIFVLAINYYYYCVLCFCGLIIY